ncbi:metal-dependent hydrolase family protein [Flammeovirga kamogawensis]|uniref:Amidohydrolase family protein n=1 Tax=Flammeovirga kamogawensis TaxID=373891 RepID=A0ABX8H457_9BACT|nr:amidohydrolase family protein [Flammeovirga kamogawensis]MBB6463533.1 imidazolonepropionase-like amidohydrolase [Flammeovirga kamogawensis]QWG10590.1 amidohydrolase family protein [Flammeovirga kamogawensis]TRX63696.1 amidohydrolase family protein [Flammeovirga kamogawensis]
MKNLFITICLLMGISSSSIGQENYKIAITNIHYWTAGMEHSSQETTTIIIENNLIKAIGAEIKIDSSYTIIDGKEHYLIPGLIDTHIHLMDSEGPAEMKETEFSYLSILGTKNANRVLMNGVTTVRDAAGPTFGLKKAIDEEMTAGPRIYPSGAALTQSGGHGDFRTLCNHSQIKGGYIDETESMGLAFIADGKTEMLKGAREQLRKGATQVKVLVSGSISGKHDPIDVVEFTEEEVNEAVKAAENWGTYVMVHAYNDKSIQMALNAGVKSIEHATLISETTAKMIKEKGAVLSTQTYVFSVDLPYFTAEQKQKRKEAEEGLNTLFSLSKKYDLLVTHSTDIYGDPNQFKNAPKEFTLRQKWFSNVEILEQATINAAQVLEMSGERNPYKEGKLGVIKEGAYADLIIINQDPTEDTKVLSNPDKNINFIMKNGKVFKNTLDK